MNESTMPTIRSWLATPMRADVADAVERIRCAPDVQHVAVMPDVHLASDTCIGVVIATSNLIYPQAVGGDIGCGMLAVAFDAQAAQLKNARVANRVLVDLGLAIPPRRRNRNAIIAQPSELSTALTDVKLDAIRKKEGELEFATLGSGNHFIELQADDEDRLWLMVHSGSRALGQAIRDHHLARATSLDGRLRALDARSDSGRAYLQDAAWARRFAAASRVAMAKEAGNVLAKAIGAELCWETLIETDHNHVACEQHGDRDLWVHRKGAMRAQSGQLGVLPGSMGTASYHIEGRGNEDSLCSSAHGAGRSMSRARARSKVSARDLREQMKSVSYDDRLTGQLRDEAPSAYKDIRAVLRAQKDLVRVIRTMRPVLSYKGL
jgi:tRNA-splicing ligase RtcB